MAFKATPMQQKAIDTDGNVLVSAAAGSGKTAVLVERVIRKLTQGEKPISADRLLIVTFTNAAAAEMRSRIEKRLHDEILKNPDDIALLRQKHLLPSADICTIDSFCIKLIRENFEDCGVEPDFSVSDGSTLVPVCKATMSKVLEGELENQTPAFLKLMELCDCEYDEQNLSSVIERIYLYSCQLPFPEQFLQNLARPYNIPFDKNHPWYIKTFEKAKESLESARLYVEKMADVAPYITKNTEKCNEYAKNTALLIDELYSVLQCGDWDKFNIAIHESSLKNVPSTESDDLNAAIFKDNKKKIVESLKDIAELFLLDAEQTQSFISEHTDAVNLLIALINDYARQLFEAFKKENSFTFYNTEQLALNLLCEYKDGKVSVRDSAKKLSERYDEVLVDEFQDVNDLQDMLFRVLSNNEEHLFVVGDVKQSIYGFRGSNPQNFLDKKQRYVAVGEAQENDAKKIILSNNFRSRGGVCDTVNYFFSLLMAGQCGSLVYNDEERLVPAAEFPECNAPNAELLLVDKCGNQDDDSLLQSEARAIAKYIKGVLGEGEVIKDKSGRLRSARYSDFVILLDAVHNKAPVISEMLLSYGIPVSYNSQGFLETVEISTALALLRVIDNPKWDVELLTVMMSPIFNFSAEDMALMRADCKSGCLYSAVTLAAQNGNKKATEFITRIAEMRRSAAILPLDRFVSKLLYITDWQNLVSAMSGGSVRRANLNTLIKLSKQYCQGRIGSIYGFINYLKETNESSFRSSVGGGDNCVRIMSMHQSKGLQFPICIISNLASRINNADSISRVLYSDELGIAFKYYNEQAMSDKRLLGHRLISDAASAKTIDERMRLLYVAMTRAEDRLCLVSACKNAEDRLQKIAATLSEKPPYIAADYIKGSNTMGDWILAGALLHPDAQKLRDIADIKLKTVATDAPLKVTVINEFFDENSDVEETEDKTEIQPDLYLADKIRKNTVYEYPYEKLRGIQAKASVSALANAAEGEHFAFTARPDFMEKDGLSAAQRGTAMHHVMQFISMDGIPDVSAELERLCEWQFITEREAEAVDRAALERFFESDLYKRIMSANELHREMRFLTEIPASRFNEALEGTDANIIVQGAVDLCFVEDDGIVVLDFKTDRVKDIKTLSETYGEQLDIYCKACEKIFKRPVKEKIIYSFHLSDYISIL